ncbi:tRNA-specific adenosine deaminase 2 [Dictyocoela muelleri]|nr:tRNA-specific adenosine deaminase 2 [Dictyocoela muelleri]
MNDALKYARIGLNKKEVPIGCIIKFDNQIVSYGHNLVNKLNDPLAHAEVVAIRKLIDEMMMFYKGGNCKERNLKYNNKDINNKDINNKYINNKYKDINNKDINNKDINNKDVNNKDNDNNKIKNNHYFNNISKELLINYLSEKYNSNDKNITLYVTCEPCLMCLGIIKRLNSKVFYGCKNPVFGGSLVENYEKGELIFNDECLLLLKMFYKKGNPRTKELGINNKKRHLK